MDFDQRKKPVTEEVVSKLINEIGILSELNVMNNAEIEEIIGFFKEIEVLASAGKSLGNRSKGIVRMIKEKVLKIAIEQDLLKMIDL